MDFRKLESGEAGVGLEWHFKFFLRFVSLSHCCLRYTLVQHRFAL